MSDTSADEVGYRHLMPGQRCRIRVWDRPTGQPRTVHESAERLYEAPNWTQDGRLVVNADGELWTLPVDGSAEPVQISISAMPTVNNDHVLSPDGTTVFVSANDWHIWSVPLSGGIAHRVTPDDSGMHFLHGVSPDGRQLGYVRLEPDGDNWWASATIHTLDLRTGTDVAVTTDPGPADGCEWTPDGTWIVFNTEQFSSAPGHTQLARVRPDGTELEQLTFDNRVNWFPHVAPSGDVAVYLSFPPGTTGHPADIPVELRLAWLPDWRRTMTLVELFGGQGTINVPSWAPDGSAFAYVDYPIGVDASSIGPKHD